MLFHRKILFKNQTIVFFITIQLRNLCIQRNNILFKTVLFLIININQTNKDTET